MLVWALSRSGALPMDDQDLGDLFKKWIETLPDVSVRFRDGPSAKWEEAKWVDILKHIRSSQALPETTEEPSWLRRWGLQRMRD